LKKKRKKRLIRDNSFRPSRSRVTVEEKSNVSDEEEVIDEEEEEFEDEDEGRSLLHKANDVMLTGHSIVAHTSEATDFTPSMLLDPYFLKVVKAYKEIEVVVVFLYYYMILFTIFHRKVHVILISLILLAIRCKRMKKTLLIGL
jgi:hypothetical protein